MGWNHSMVYTYGHYSTGRWKVSVNNKQDYH